MRAIVSPVDQQEGQPWEGPGGKNGGIFAPVDLQERNSAQSVRNEGNSYPCWWAGEGNMRAAREKGMGEYLPLLMSRRGNHESSQGERNGGIFAPVDEQERESW
jgi:hypothetical protein